MLVESCLFNKHFRIFKNCLTMESVSLAGQNRHDCKNTAKQETCKKIKEYKIDKKLETKTCLANKQCFHFIEFFGKLLGWQFIYEWKSNPRHWCTYTIAAFSLTQSLYTIVNQLMNQEYRNVLSSFTILCITASVYSHWIPKFRSSKNK